jgi:CubicO group peptidase (beta-lactamase class C family)
MSGIINNKLTESNCTGFSMAVVDNQRIIGSKGLGRADMEGNIPATSETLYLVATITMVFRTAAIMQLAEQSQLGVGHSYLTYAPELSMNTRFGSIEDITFRNIILAEVYGLSRKCIACNLLNF